MSRAEKYSLVQKQVKSLLDDNSHLISDLANIAAVLKETFDFFWVGFYLADSKGDLYLGPFQGPLACTNIELGKGVCGTSAKEQRTIRVADVHDFPGHISCNAASKSELVVPLVASNACQLVLDIDSDQLNDFHQEDEDALEQLVRLIQEKHFS